MKRAGPGCSRKGKANTEPHGGSQTGRVAGAWCARDLENEGPETMQGLGKAGLERMALVPRAMGTQSCMVLEECAALDSKNEYRHDWGLEGPSVPNQEIPMET